MAEPPKRDSFPESSRDNDAGANFVLESKGQWWHAGYHLTTAIVGPTILTLPYAFRGMGWVLGVSSLTVMGVISFYSYYLMSLVLDFCERDGRRHIRFRELAADVLGIYAGTTTFYIHNLNINTTERTCNYVLLCAAVSKNAPPRDYTLESQDSHKVFSAFTSLSIIAAIFGNGILPEIQATLAPPATGKMLKGLVMCYSVILVTFYSVSISGYFVFGNKSSSNIIQNFIPDQGPALAPTWVLGGATLCVLFQLLAIGLVNNQFTFVSVYSQVAFEVMEKKSADPSKGMFSIRNLIPRIILRSLYMAACGFVAAMLPFFGDINGIVGAIGFIPLDFILPMLLYNITFKPSKSSSTYWINMIIMVVFTGVGLLGAFASMRKLVLDAHKFKIFSSDVVD
ncbi:Probable GABA transporter 2 [Linum perenne]